MENYFESESHRRPAARYQFHRPGPHGDAVFEVLVRTWLCAHGKATGRGLAPGHHCPVRAESQAEKAERILPLLTEEEAAGGSAAGGTLT